MTLKIVLESGPLGLLCSSSNKKGMALNCKEWASDLIEHDFHFIIREISDYEVRRELIRAGFAASVTKSNSLIEDNDLEYLPISTAAMRKTAELWANARQTGKPTASDKALDADVILTAQVFTYGDPEILIATTNMGRLSRFTPAKEWRQITKP